MASTATSTDPPTRSLWSRDALGTIHKLKQFRANEPASDDKPARAADIHLTAHTPLVMAAVPFGGQNPDKIVTVDAPNGFSIDAPRKRRTLPTPPAPKAMVQDLLASASVDYGAAPVPAPLPKSTMRSTFSKQAIRSNRAYAEDEDEDCAELEEEAAEAARAGGGRYGGYGGSGGDGPPPAGRAVQPLPPLIICKFYCTSQGPNTCLRCINCAIEYCSGCLYGENGPMFAYDEFNAMTLKCGKCKKNPRSCPNDIRPPWSGCDSSVAGAPLPLNIDRTEREKQRANQLIYDKDFLLALRKPDTTPLGATLPQSDEIPEVFNRLTNPKLFVVFSGTHKHRFDDQGRGRGIEGRRDDITLQTAIRGESVIVRDSTPSFDSPNRPQLSFDTNIRSNTGTLSRPGSATPSRTPSAVASPRRQLNSTDVFSDDVFERLTAKSPRKSLSSAAEDDYESAQKIRKTFGINKDLIPTWQSGL